MSELSCKVLPASRWLCLSMCLIAFFAADASANPMSKEVLSVTVNGVSSDITIYRDKWGIPAVFASNNEDLLFGWGYVVAEDRLFQMEVIRRTNMGTMAEIFGNKHVKSDRASRIKGIRQLALKKLKALQPDQRELLHAYAEGVNSYLHNNDVSRRVGFRELGLLPAPWTLEDIMTCGESMMISNVHRGDRLVEKVGLELARELYPGHPADMPVVVPESEMAKNKTVYERLKSRNIPVPRRPATVTQTSLTGSNGFVVAGSKSTSGKPILVADPQQSPRIPNSFHEIVLHGGDFHARGVSRPGVPGLLVGFTRTTSWTVTGLGADRIDLYEEKVDPENPDRYLYKGRWEKMGKRTEVIKVRGGDDVTLEARSTRHGPVCGDLVGEPNKVISMRHPAYETPDNRAISCLRITLAKNYTEFQNATSKWEARGANLIYADVEGNIAYWPAGAVPIRPKGQFWGPLPGWTGEYEWEGLIPFGEKPTLLNPDQGFIVTANNVVVGDWYPYTFVYRTGPGPRFLRLREIVMSQDKFDQDDMERVRADITPAPDARPNGPLICDIVSRTKGVPTAVKEAADRIAKWDYRLDTDSVAGTIFDKFVRGLKEDIFRPRLGDDYKIAAVGGWDIHFLLKENSKWFDDPATSRIETRDETFYNSFKETIEELTKTLGPDQSTWTWGTVSTTEIRDQMKELGLGDKIELPNFGKFVMEGSKGMTPHVLKVHSYSQIVDMADVDKTRAVLAVGNSELYDSPHSHDQIKLWTNFKLRPAPLSAEKVKDLSKSILVLKSRG
ncbi:penicillin acylase family protein [Candidatus Hydrogenedentota bacterium]